MKKQKLQDEAERKFRAEQAPKIRELKDDIEEFNKLPQKKKEAVVESLFDILCLTFWRESMRSRIRKVQGEAININKIPSCFGKRMPMHIKKCPTCVYKKECKYEEWRE